MPIPEQFLKHKRFINGNKPALIAKLKSKTPKTQSDITWYDIVHKCYFAAENDELLIGFFQIPFENNNSNPGVPLPRIASLSLEILEKNFNNDPEKVNAGLIIPVFFDVDWTLGMHSHHECSTIAKILGIDLKTLNAEYKTKLDKENLQKFMYDLIQHQQKNKNILLNNPQDTAAIMNYLSTQSKFSVNIVSYTEYTVWLDLLLSLLTTYEQWGDNKNWHEIIFGWSASNTINKMVQISSILLQNLKNPGVIAYRLVCLVDDDKEIISDAEKRGAKCFTATGKNNAYLLELSDFLFLNLTLEERNSVEKSSQERLGNRYNEQAFFPEPKRSKKLIKKEEMEIEQTLTCMEELSSSSSDETEIPLQLGSQKNDIKIK